MLLFSTSFHDANFLIETVLVWLAASPDAIVVDPTQDHQKRGCLEVKCPYACEKILFAAACKEVPGFCLVLICPCQEHIHIFTKCRLKCMPLISHGVTYSSKQYKAVT